MEIDLKLEYICRVNADHAGIDLKNQKGFGYISLMDRTATLATCPIIRTEDF